MLLSGHTIQLDERYAAVHCLANVPDIFSPGSNECYISIQIKNIRSTRAVPSPTGQFAEQKSQHARGVMNASTLCSKNPRVPQDWSDKLKQLKMILQLVSADAWTMSRSVLKFLLVHRIPLLAHNLWLRAALGWSIWAATLAAALRRQASTLASWWHGRLSGCAGWSPLQIASMGWLQSHLLALHQLCNEWICKTNFSS